MAKATFRQHYQGRKHVKVDIHNPFGLSDVL